MTCQIGKRTVWLAALFAALACASTASAQVFTGRIDVTVEDSTGGRLPGVNVELTGPVNQIQVTDAQGQAHFLNLPVGIYTVKADTLRLQHLHEQHVQVVSGAQHAAVDQARASPAPPRRSTSPRRRRSSTSSATRRRPTSRSRSCRTFRARAIRGSCMQTVPTVFVDRVNVGGAESGQQSNYNAKGAQDTDNTWSIDGVPVTDMGATGSSPTYYDFDSSRRWRSRPAAPTRRTRPRGVQLNMVLKQGHQHAARQRALSTSRTRRCRR